MGQIAMLPHDIALDTVRRSDDPCEVKLDDLGNGRFARAKFLDGPEQIDVRPSQDVDTRDIPSEQRAKSAVSIVSTAELGVQVPGVDDPEPIVISCRGFTCEVCGVESVRNDANGDARQRRESARQ